LKSSIINHIRSLRIIECLHPFGISFIHFIDEVLPQVVTIVALA
jgi:hypothetical protein